MTIRILIVDDHGVLRAGLRALLSAEPNIEVVDEAPNGQTALKLAHDLKPDLILLDISMPDMGGIEVTRHLKKDFPDLKILILTVHEDHSLLKEAIRAGASGYILKQAVESELIEAIRTVEEGEMYVHPSMTHALIKALADPPEAEEDQVEPLTPRENEVLSLIAQGYTNRQIAKLLSISIRTVESHRSNLMGKLGMHSRVELVRYAMEHDMFE